MSDCEQCKNQDQKGMHTCGIDHQQNRANEQALYVGDYGSGLNMSFPDQQVGANLSRNPMYQDQHAFSNQIPFAGNLFLQETAEANEKKRLDAMKALLNLDKKERDKILKFFND